MDLRLCDRCGREFRVSKSVSGEMVAPVLPSGVERKDPPFGLKDLNRLTLPLTIKDAQVAKEKGGGYVVAERDFCAPCTAELAPFVADWFSKKERPARLGIVQT